MTKRRGWLLGSLLLYSMLSFACDYQIPLSADYKIGRTAGGDTFVLAGPGDSVIAGPSVIGYRDLEDLIVGLVETPYRQSEGYREGYFLVDKQTQTAFWSLSKREWLEKLQEHGIEKEPPLIRPNRFQAWF